MAKGKKIDTFLETYTSNITVNPYRSLINTIFWNLLGQYFGILDTAADKYSRGETGLRQG